MAASMIRNMNGVHCQTSTRAIKGIASEVFDRKSVRENPSNEMSQFNTPDSVLLSMKRQSNPTTTGASASGNQNERAEEGDPRHIAAEDEGQAES